MRLKPNDKVTFARWDWSATVDYRSTVYDKIAPIADRFAERLLSVASRSIERAMNRSAKTVAGAIQEAMDRTGVHASLEVDDDTDHCDLVVDLPFLTTRFGSVDFRVGLDELVDDLIARNPEDARALAPFFLAMFTRLNG